MTEYLNKRKEELEAEFKKGAEALQELEVKAREINSKLALIKGAYAEVNNQLEVKDDKDTKGSKEDSEKGSKKGS